MNAKLPIVFLVLCAAIAAGARALWLAYPAYDLLALIGADLVMLALSLVAWAIFRREVSDRPQAFVRSVYSATMLRLFVCMAAIITYALVNRPHVHKPTLFAMFGIYALYTIVETAAFSRKAKKV